ncbi:MAG: GNAT family N-acetyltransferase [Pseudomonadota bacterium]
MSGEITFEIGNAPDLIERAQRIRRTVFVIEQNVAPDEEWDGKDEACFHFLVKNAGDGEDIATGRLMVIEDTAKLQRIAVLKSFRGRAIGQRLIDEMLGHARTLDGVSNALLGAQCYAIPFYEKLGFEAFGDVYDDAGIPHRDMKRVL